MIPKFAVVGHPNKGKSSIVATLSENQRVAISPMPGTTYRADEFTFTINDQPQYILVDTPGFQRAGEVLAWLQAHETNASERRQTVADFVAQHADNDRFHDECELLRPILEGAGILYVVDGAKPYGVEYELEMQILQWTGQPRMALINQIGPGNYVEQWEQALGQYFSLVRNFDALHADFEKRLNLLRAFGELDEQWREPLQKAVTALTAERQRQQHRAATEIANLLIDCLTATIEEPLPDTADDAQIEQRQAALQQKLLKRLRQREQRARNAVQAIYRHDTAQRQETELEVVEGDLFTTETWELFGLSKLQLIATGGLSGAVAGGGLDLLVGGASLFAGAIGGALLGGLGAWWGSDELAQVKVLGSSLGGKQLQAGPVTSPNFAWVLLGRAWIHHRLTSERNHALRTAINTELLEASAFEHLATGQRNDLERALTPIRKADVTVEARSNLVRRIEGLLTRAVTSSEPL